MLSAALRARPPAARSRLSQMTAQFTNGANSASSTLQTFKTLRDLPKSNVFTSNLPSDPAFETPKDSHNAPRESLGPRMVKGALYTYVRPEPTLAPELLGVSDAALRDLALSPDATKDAEFVHALAGNEIISWDESTGIGVYPWAQCYGGFQFGQWAGQLGDGRAISLFETTNPNTGVRYELQLKGAGKTPYSRFADGKAVLRSSIREFVVSEYLNAIGIPTTRALSLVLCPRAKVMRERMEPGAIVARFAQSWIRLGTFDLLRARGERKLLRTLATYVAEHVYGGWEKLPGKLASLETDRVTVTRGVAKDAVEGEGKDAENRFVRLYREIARRNATTVAAWQAYGFMNGVLNTDNTSILGLSMDYGPFAFMDNFDPSYTPNHDDHMLRYSYRNQPTIIWWNLVRLGEALGELLGSGARVEDEEFVNQGVRENWADELVQRAENIIDQTGEEYKAVFINEYKRLMTARLGLKSQKPSDFDTLFSEWLDLMEAHELDFNQSFRRLCDLKTADLETGEQREKIAERFFHNDGVAGGEDAARQRIGKWLESWQQRVLKDWGEGKDDERIAAMKSVNPKFVPKGWVLDELIDRVERKHERDVLKTVMNMTLNPFEEKWDVDEQDEERFCADPPKYNRAMQCSCSS
ncbi:YdiU domain-containing protein [Macrophomina phaseolina]|uniref:Selenoprotein O n=1 Tax=Macrophomina phaseolina TaxID=35725 RepID=A0ABQ8G732_9PEZI|nr:YdiU domain-containing protein [Macrophomina phaseolina]